MSDEQRSSITVERRTQSDVTFFYARRADPMVSPAFQAHIVDVAVSPYLVTLHVRGPRSVEVQMTHEELRALVRILEEVRPDELEGHGAGDADAWPGPNGPELAP